METLCFSVVTNMRALAIFTFLLSAAAALPSSRAARDPKTHDLQVRDTRILDYTIQTWPDQETFYNNQSFAFFTVKPQNDTHYLFGFSNADAPNAGTINVFTVTGEGLKTIVESLTSGKFASRVVEKTKKPFRIVNDSNFP